MSREVSPSGNRSLWRAAGGPGLGHIAGHAVSSSSRRRRRHRPSTGAARAHAGRGLVEAIRELLAASPFHGEGYRKIWARLRFAGIRTSKRRVLRLMREHGLLAPGRVGRPHGPKATTARSAPSGST